MPVLEVSGLEVRYGSVTAVKGISLEVAEGEVVAIIGPNGAGKTSTLRAITGLVPTAGGRVVFRGTDVSRWKAHRIVTLGLGHAPEGRRLFPQMTVMENLRMGAYRRRGPAEIGRTLAQVEELFPRLAERRAQLAGTLSGGEQQMLAIGRALMAEPRLLVLDEPSFGLAPMIVREIGRIVRSINRERGVSVLLVEQNARMALGIAGRAYVMETGRVALSGLSATLAESPHVKAAYLGG
ncbi:MAG TPA: ABC transporter ATP-binding protein [Candidatus Dormibacteraeota bacterium]|nr:ABC transporter ATP-binding protein [Candidatus Dormibacteraeota bacterium]